MSSPDTSGVAVRRSPRPPLPRAARIAALVAALVTAGVFSATICGKFLEWDDRSNFIDNPYYRGFTWRTVDWAFTNMRGGPYQPLSWLSYALDDALWSGSPYGYHATNVVLQSVGAALLALVAWRLLPKAVPGLSGRTGFRGAISCGAALLWAVHPLRVESVAWATERRDVLSGAFLIATLLAWLSHTDEDADPAARPWWKRGAYWAAFGLCAASLLSKATAMGFVLVLVLLDRHPLRRAFREHWQEKIPFALLGLGIAAAAWVGQRPTIAAQDMSSAPVLGRLVLAAFASANYIARTVVPVGLRAHYLRPVGDALFRADIVTGAAAAAVLLAVVVWCRNRLPSLATALGAYAVLLAPVSGLTVIGAALVSDRYSHQPGMPLALLTAGALAWLVAGETPRLQPRAAVAILGAAVVLSGAWAVRLSLTWRDDETLWARVVELEPDNTTGREQMWNCLYVRGEYDRAAAQLDAGFGGIWGTLRTARRLLGDGRIDDAARFAARAAAGDPSNAEVWNLAGDIELARGSDTRAESAYRKALDLGPDNVGALESLNNLLTRQGRTAEAERFVRQTCDRLPRNASAKSLLGVICAQRGAFGEAETLLRDAIALDPKSNVARGNLAAVYANTGRTAEAERVLHEIIAVGEPPVASLELLAVLAAGRGALDEAANFAVRAAENAPPGPVGADVRIRAIEALVAAGRRDEAKSAAADLAEMARRNGDAALAERAERIVR